MAWDCTFIRHRCAYAVPLACLAVICSARAARAQPFTPGAGAAGTYGVPYGYLGPGGTRVFEQYRKKVDQRTPPGPAVAATNISNPTRVLFSNLWQGCDSSGQVCAYQAPGIFVGTAVSRRSPPSARLELVEVRLGDGGVLGDMEIRCGFVEHLAADGGAPFNTFVSNLGGDNGDVDLYDKNWGVDGLYQRWRFENTGATWVIFGEIPNLVAAGSQLLESARTSYAGQLTVAGATKVGTRWDTGIPSTTPLSFEWALRQAGADTSIDVVMGGQVTATWVFDNGTNRRGLTDPGNTDGERYQGGRLDLDRMVPTLYLGRRNPAGVLESWPPSTFELGVIGTADAGEADAGGTDAGGPDAGGTDAGGTDAGGADAGRADAGNGNGGVGVDGGDGDAGSEQGTPALAPADFRVGCGCRSTGESALLALWLFAAASASRRSPAETSTRRRPGPLGRR